jgi:hypothetical protein
MRKIVLILFVFCASQLAFSQKTNEETPQPELKLENRTWVVNSPTIFESQNLSIKVKGSNHLIKGNYSSFTDSTLVVDNTTIAFSDIESIRVTKHRGLGVGVAMLVAGVSISGIGLVALSRISEYEGFLEELALIIVGGSAVTIGAVMSALSTIIISSSTHTYKTEKWKLYVSYPEQRDKKKKE